MPSYPDEKSRVSTETENTIQKLTHEFSISPTYSCIKMIDVCASQLQLLYKNQDKPIPKDLENLITTIIPSLLKDHQELIEEQHLMLNTSGTA